MRITKVTTAVVQANFDYVFVRVHTDKGVDGTGEAFFAPGLPSIIRDLGEVIIGLDPRQIRPLWLRLQEAAGGTAGHGIAFNAISGIETALWDLAGKALGAPIATLLGGQHRREIDVYVDLHAGDQLMSLDNVMRYRTPFWSSSSGITETRGSFWEEGDPGADSLEAMIDRATAAVAQGFTRLKFDLDVFGRSRVGGDRSITQKELADIEERAVSVRHAVGPDIGIAFDCHWRFDIPTALSVAEAVAPAQPMWLEDPVPPHVSTFRAVTDRSPVPIATGENVYLLDGFLALIEGNSLHIVTPDAQKTGGLLETLRIADVAGRRFMPIAPHCIASPLGFMASA
ncbi:MAG: mandelate racemase/muconate lactonizing enzyme family protein, partial [Acidimicrobiia bacterium]